MRIDWGELSMQNYRLCVEVIGVFDRRNNTNDMTRCMSDNNTIRNVNTNNHGCNKQGKEKVYDLVVRLAVRLAVRLVVRLAEDVSHDLAAQDATTGLAEDLCDLSGPQIHSLDP